MVGDYPSGGAVEASTNVAEEASEDNNPALASSETTAIEPQPHHRQRMGTN